MNSNIISIYNSSGVNSSKIESKRNFGFGKTIVKNKRYIINHFMNLNGEERYIKSSKDIYCTKPYINKSFVGSARKDLDNEFVDCAKKDLDDYVVDCAKKDLDNEFVDCACCDGRGCGYCS